MKLLIVSDNHGDKNILEEILKKEQYDISLHLGDAGISKEWLEEHFTHIVSGNHAFWEPTEKIIEIGGLKIMMLHGHTVGINMFKTEEHIKKILSNLDVDLLIHGHTHVFAFGEFNGKHWLCPGSTSLSRGPEGNGYVILVIENRKIKNVEFKESKYVQTSKRNSWDNKTT